MKWIFFALTIISLGTYCHSWLTLSEDRDFLILGNIFGAAFTIMDQIDRKLK